MALSRATKEAIVARYRDRFAEAQHAFVLGYKGIKVSEVDELRKRVREQGGSYSVLKNRLALRALDGTGLEVLKEHLDGPIAIATAKDDPVALAKALSEFAKEVPVLEFRAGLVDGQLVAGDEIQAIAALPSREQLLAKLLFLLQSPIVSLVRDLAAIQGGLVIALDQIRQQKEAAG